MTNALDNVAKTRQHLEGVHSRCSALTRWILNETGPLKVVEIGTSYGRQLQTFAGQCSKLICIDAMYDWVPDVMEHEGHEKERVDEKKLAEWKKNAASFNAELIIGNSFHVANDEAYAEKLRDTNLLIVDGCHHPGELVAKDYENFLKYMSDPHYVVWDDLYMGDVLKGIVIAKELLRSRGYEYHELTVDGALAMYVKGPRSVNGSTRPS